jgi:hypothetical protein
LPSLLLNALGRLKHAQETEEGEWSSKINFHTIFITYLLWLWDCLKCYMGLAEGREASPLNACPAVIDKECEREIMRGRYIDEQRSSMKHT